MDLARIKLEGGAAEMHMLREEAASLGMLVALALLFAATTIITVLAAI